MRCASNFDSAGDGVGDESAAEGFEGLDLAGYGIFADFNRLRNIIDEFKDFGLFG